MPYLRAKAGIPASAAYARTAAYTSFRGAEARGCPGRPRAESAAAFAEVTPTTLPIKSETRAISCPIVMAPPPGCSQLHPSLRCSHLQHDQASPQSRRHRFRPVRSLEFLVDGREVGLNGVLGYPEPHPNLPVHEPFAEQR